jgi:exopolysaccharide biosynthesis predicted pyruvyltransferase EpsI
MFTTDDPYVKFLHSRKGGRVYLKPYSGNSGDALIWMGNEVLLNELGLNRVLNPKKADIILWPGGNPTMWNGNLTGWQDCWKRWPAAEFVVGPATFQGGDLPWQKMLKTTHAKIAGLFARDPESYQNLCRLDLPTTVQVGLGHDPAFHLKDTKWINELREACSLEYILASFRGDHESAMRLPQANRLFRTWPFSSIFHRYRYRCQTGYYQERLNKVRQMSKSNLPLIEQDAPALSFESFVEFVQRASQVHTDRLHCMILSVLLGKDVYAYPTAYGKLEAVYKHSINSWAKVHFVNQP